MTQKKPSDIFIHAIRAQRHKQEREADNHVRYTFDRLSTAFLFAGECLKKEEYAHIVEDMEYIFNTIFSMGYCPFAKYKDYWEGVFGTMNGELNRQFDYTKVTFANPALGFYEDRTIGEDVFIMQCDSMRMGLIPLISRYANAMAINETTMNIADIWSRMPALISAPDDDTKKAADDMIENLQNGKLSVVGDNAFFDGIKAQPLHSGANSELTNLIEFEQYMKASLNNELGLDMNFNMKRESISAGETKQQDNLSPLMDSILLSLNRSCEKMNKKTGDDLHVIYNPEGVWGRNEREAEAETQQMENEANMDTEDVKYEQTPDVPDVQDENTPDVSDEDNKPDEENTPDEDNTPGDETDDTSDVTIEINVNKESEDDKDDDERTDENDSSAEDDA